MRISSKINSYTVSFEEGIDCCYYNFEKVA